jgi:hypothetical protein
MPNSGSNYVKTAARRVQKTRGIRYTEALRLVREAKTDDRTWTETADHLISQED